MKVEEVTVAEDELSHLKVTRHTAENYAEVQELLSRGKVCTFWEEIRAFADDCDNLLSEQGWPPACAAIIYRGDSEWCLYDPVGFDDLGSEWNFARGLSFIEKRTADFSDAWYAARLSWKCRKALEHFEEGKGAQPFLHLIVCQIGQLQTDWQWRRSRKKQILTGKKQRAYLERTRSAHNKAKQASVERRRILVAALMEETNRSKGALDRWLREQLFERFEITVSLRTVKEDRRAITEKGKKACSTG